MSKNIKISIVIMAAGKGSRLKVSTAKPLLHFCGEKLIDFPILSAHYLFNQLKLEGNISVIVNYKKELIRSYLSKYNDLDFVDQKHPLGTGHAIQSYFNQTDPSKIGEYIIVTCADTPLINGSIFAKLVEKIERDQLNSVVASFSMKDPFGYGRIIKNNDTGLQIIEEKDASDVQRLVHEVNSGLYVFKSSFLKEQVFKINNKNKSQEYYLTDVFKGARNTESLLFKNDFLFRGINTLAQLEQMQKIKREMLINQFQEQGVQFIDSKTVYIDMDVKIASDTIIYPNVHLRGKTVIEKCTIINANCIIKNSVIAENVEILPYTTIENSQIKSGASIGPYARIRPGTTVASNCKIGNFVEIKNSNLSEGVKISHLSYVGDAQIGQNSNIGCGFITCNYDGKEKHKTTIGRNCFIGSASQAIAPITIGDDCFVASGTTVHKNMVDGSFAISRGKQITKNGLAKKFIKK